MTYLSVLTQYTRVKDGKTSDDGHQRVCIDSVSGKKKITGPILNAIISDGKLTNRLTVIAFPAFPAGNRGGGPAPCWGRQCSESQTGPVMKRPGEIQTRRSAGNQFKTAKNHVKDNRSAHCWR